VNVFVVAEHSNGSVLDITWELINAACSIGSHVSVAAIGPTAASLVGQLNVAGVSEVVVVPTSARDYDSDTYRAAVYRICATEVPDVILLGFTVNSLEYGPAVAAKMRCGIATDVFALRVEHGSVVATRSYYASKVHADLTFGQGAPVMLLLRRGVWPATRNPGSASTRIISGEPYAPRVEHQEFIEPVADGGADITTADFLLSVGRGIGGRENLSRFEALAKKMGATLSVSRPLVDGGWMPRSRQVGQSGQTVKPKVYLALGVSGAVQHIAGMKNSGLIIAINIDAEASIFQFAHYGSTVDLFDFAEELEKLA
jgi:electron transfer flavoprotein alpha subunit